MKLKSRIKTVIEVEFGDFDNFVSEIYGCNYEFVAEEEANNYSNYNYPISKKDKYDKWEIEAMEKVRAGDVYGYGVSASDILQTLLEDGHIVEGEYLINVSW